MSEATGQVVASTQTGRDLQRQESDLKMDYSKLSLTQAKRLEMESQVKALELEKELETERTRLAELRKIHYHIAGASEGWEEEVGLCVSVRAGRGVRVERMCLSRLHGVVSQQLCSYYGHTNTIVKINGKVGCNDESDLVRHE